MSKKRSNGPGKPDPDDDSLDFSDVASGRAPPPEPVLVDNQPQRPKPRRRRAAPARIVVETVQPVRTRIGLILVVIALGAVAAYVLSDEASPPPEAPRQAVKPAPYSPAPAPSQPPSAKAPAPEPAAPQAPAAPTIPPEFMTAFKDYQARPGSKAIALALDRNGRWSYGIIAGHLTQGEADGEALAECTRRKAESGVQETCRLYASGDKVVW